MTRRGGDTKRLTITHNQVVRQRVRVKRPVALLPSLAPPISPLEVPVGGTVEVATHECRAADVTKKWLIGPSLVALKLPAAWT
jgi:hypothetical protein